MSNMLGNRRKKRQEYLLDVKVQTEGRTWRSRRRGIAVLAILAVVAGTSYGLYRFGKLASANRRSLKIRRATVRRRPSSQSQNRASGSWGFSQSGSR